MFRKLVSSLPFSPAMIGQLGPYARELKREQTARRIGIIFTCLALVVQSFAIFSPPEQALASSVEDIIPGGITSSGQALVVYDGSNDFKNLLTYLGVTRQEIVSLSNRQTTICSSDTSVVLFSRQSHYSVSEGELAHRVQSNDGSISTFYSAPLHRFDTSDRQTNCYTAYTGYSQQAGWFAVNKTSGDVLLHQNAQKHPRAHFTHTSCSTIQGFAYDERHPDQKLQVYLFIGGPPGKGALYGPLVASQDTVSSPVGSGHGFTFAIPEAYQNLEKNTDVWGVVRPAAGWTETAVQFDAVASLPTHCQNATRAPVASCDLLQTLTIDQNKFKLVAHASAINGARIKSYNFNVVNISTSKQAYQQAFNSSDSAYTSPTIELRDPGSYRILVTAQTSIGDFISKDCTKNIVVSPTTMCMYDPTVLPDSPSCQACPYNEYLWIRDQDCTSTIVLSKEGRNLSQSKPAADSTAQPGDRIQFDLYTTNFAGPTGTTSIKENIKDALEYATVIDTGGGTLDTGTGTISWGPTSLTAGATDTRSFLIQVNDDLASTPRAANAPASYDCIVTNTYGNTIDIRLHCPISKTIEETIRRLPAIGYGPNITFGIILVLLALFFYARTRQINRELRLIRNDFEPSAHTLN